MSFRGIYFPKYTPPGVGGKNKKIGFGEKNEKKKGKKKREKGKKEKKEKRKKEKKGEKEKKWKKNEQKRGNYLFHFFSPTKGDMYSYIFPILKVKLRLEGGRLQSNIYLIFFPKKRGNIYFYIQYTYIFPILKIKDEIRG